MKPWAKSLGLGVIAFVWGGLLGMVYQGDRFDSAWHGCVQACGSSATWDARPMDESGVNSICNCEGELKVSLETP